MNFINDNGQILDHNGNYVGYYERVIEDGFPYILRHDLQATGQEYVLTERYGLNEQHQVQSLTQYSTNEKRNYRKPVRTLHYDNSAEFEAVRNQTAEPTRIQYHLVDDIKSKFEDYSRKVTNTKEQIADRIRGGVDRANYARDSMGIIAMDIVQQKKNQGLNQINTIKTNINNKFTSLKQSINNKKNQTSSTINKNKEKVFSKLSGIRKNITSKTQNSMTSAQNAFNKTKENINNSLNNTYSFKQARKNTQMPQPLVFVINNTSGNIEITDISQAVYEEIEKIRNNDVEVRKNKLQSLKQNKASAVIKM